MSSQGSRRGGAAPVPARGQQDSSGGSTRYREQPAPRSGTHLRRPQRDPVDTRIYRFPNDYAAIGSFVEQLLEPGLARMNATTRDELSLALRELLLNAVEHGNLGLSYEEKSAALEAGTWKALVSARQCSSPYAARETHVTAVWHEDRVQFRIRDEGRGFDWQKLPDPMDPENLLCDHGRGVLMARLSVDDLRYNEKGNEVTISKRFVDDPPSP